MKTRVFIVGKQGSGKSTLVDLLRKNEFELVDEESGAPRGGDWILELGSLTRVKSLAVEGAKKARRRG